MTRETHLGCLRLTIQRCCECKKTSIRHALCTCCAPEAGPQVGKSGGEARCQLSINPSTQIESEKRRVQLRRPRQSKPYTCMNIQTHGHIYIHVPYILFTWCTLHVYILHVGIHCTCCTIYHLSSVKRISDPLLGSENNAATRNQSPPPPSLSLPLLAGDPGVGLGLGLPTPRLGFGFGVGSWGTGLVAGFFTPRYKALASLRVHERVYSSMWLYMAIM